MITRIVQSFFRTLSPQISPNQIFSVSDEMLIKRFVKLLETLVGVHSGLQLGVIAVLQTNISSSLKIIKRSIYGIFATNERIYDFYLGLLTKLQLSTDDLNSVVIKILVLLLGIVWVE